MKTNELVLSDSEKFLAPSFLEKLKSGEFVFDVTDNEGLTVKITTAGSKWVRYAKKVDKHFNFEEFCAKVISYSLQSYENEKESAT